MLAKIIYNGKSTMGVFENYHGLFVINGLAFTEKSIEQVKKHPTLNRYIITLNKKPIPFDYKRKKSVLNN